MIKPELKSINVTLEEWGETEQDFWIVVEIGIGPRNEIGDELFTVNVASVKRLQKSIESNGIEIGRGLLIMDDFNINLVERTMEQLLRSCERPSWNEVVLAFCRYAFWEYEQ